jgi:CLIP-associating protein 1/2
MEAQARRVLAALKNHDVSVETKSSEIAELKSTIKRQVVPDAAINSLIEVVKSSMTSQHSALVGQGLSTLGHLLKRLSLQSGDHLTHHAPRILPLILEALGDRKDRHRALAMQCLTDVWLAVPQDVERMVRESTMSSKNPRTKESSMQWLATVCTKILHPSYLWRC